MGKNLTQHFANSLILPTPHIATVSGFIRRLPSKICVKGRNAQPKTIWGTPNSMATFTDNVQTPSIMFTFL